MSKKVVVIGGGLGGLLSGAILAKEGFAVTLVEKNHKIGGCLQSYKRFGEVFDTGMHVLGGMQKDGNIHRIFNYLDILNDFKIAEIDKDICYKVFVAEDNKLYEIGQGKNGFINSLSSYFPGEKHNLENYLSEIYRIMYESDLFNLRRLAHNIYDCSQEYSMSADQLIEKYIANRKLQSIISSINTLYAGEKGVTPSILHAAISMNILNGACRVIDGFQHIANALGNCIKINGGEIITDDEVISIMTTEKMITNVRTTKGLLIGADYFISAISPIRMLEIMDNKHVFTNIYQSFIENSRDSYSAFILNIKLKENVFRYSNHIFFYLEKYDSDWSVSDGKTVEKFMYMTPPAESQGIFARTLSVTALMKWEAVESWSDTHFGNRSDDYLCWKQKIRDEIVYKLAKAIPGFDQMVVDVDMISPLTIRDYTAVRRGAMCGIRKNCNDMISSFLPVKTKVKNLLLTGQNCNFHGFCGVSLTAIQTCEEILGKNFLIDTLNSIR